MPSLSADSTQPLDVGPGRGGAAGLAKLLHQHVDQLDVEGLVTDLDLMPQAKQTMAHILTANLWSSALETEPPTS